MSDEKQTPPQTPDEKAAHAAKLRAASRSYSAPSAPTVIGLTTVTFGSGSALQGGIATAILEGISFTEHMDEPMVEDNNGFTAAVAVVRDGWDCEATAVYDSAITWTANDAEVLIKWPRFPFGLYFHLVTMGDEKKRKGFMSRKMKFRNRPGINTAAPSS